MKLYAVYEMRIDIGPVMRIHLVKENGDDDWFIGKANCEKFIPFPCAEFDQEIIDHILFNVDKEQLRDVLERRDASDARMSEDDL